jgi:excisionase family DNA binding protein
LTGQGRPWNTGALAERIKALPADRQGAAEELLSKEFYTVEEAAALLRLHPETLRRAIRNGRLRAVKLAAIKGCYRIPAEELERFKREGASG